jgi:hypothetical protein
MRHYAIEVDGEWINYCGNDGRRTFAYSWKGVTCWYCKNAKAEAKKVVA